MLNRAEKAEIVRELEDRLGRQRVAMFVDISGVGVAKLSLFRRELRKIGAELKVAKKTLLDRALAAAGPAFGAVEPKRLAGEVGVVFGYEDQTAPAKAAAKFARENETFKVLKGLLAGKVIEAADILALARLSSRAELLGELARVLNVPIRGLATALQGNLRNLVVVLDQVKSRK